MSLGNLIINSWRTYLTQIYSSCERFNIILNKDLVMCMDWICIRSSVKHADHLSPLQIVSSIVMVLQYLSRNPQCPFFERRKPKFCKFQKGGKPEKDWNRAGESKRRFHKERGEPIFSFSIKI